MSIIYIHYAVLAVMLVLTIFAYYRKTHISDNIYLAFILFLSIMWALRPITMGSDTIFYVNSFKSHYYTQLSNVPSGREILFYIFVVIVKFIFNDPRVLFFSVSIFVNMSLFFLFKEYSRHYALLYCYYLAHFLFLTFNINILRQGMASSLIFVSLISYHRNLSIKSFTLYMSAVLVHLSSIIAIVYHLLFNLKNRLQPKIVYDLLALIIVVLTFINANIKNLMSIFSQYIHLIPISEILKYRIIQYLSIENSANVSFSYYLTILIFLTYSSIRKKTDSVYIGMFAYLVIYAFASTNEILVRLSFYLWIFEFIAIGRIIDYNRYTRNIMPALVMLFVIATAAKTYISLTESGFLK
jgi:hypothetical protein